ncbi:MAG: hypothetical protein ONB46_24515 [candidate division KSB1 bacterium]|nr:hypothetical protein [candidate division KSB1 bacterium]MDZ7369020.1 hypothetical protein [candidate division KSB1 bacterium]MDZ7407056.1 hypothetical protein [candidate division KSB1 bacterium]
MQKISLCLAMLMAVMSFAIPLAAQSIWLDRRHDQSLGLEVLIPDFKPEDGEGVSGWALFLSLRAPLSNQLRFIGEMPFVHADFESRSFLTSSSSQNSIGNPYLGLEIGRQGSPVFGEFGVRAPLASEDKFDAALVGLITDFDRVEAFLPNVVSISGMLNVHQVSETGFALRLRAGPSLLVSTEDEDDDTELSIGYSAQAGYETEAVSILGGVTGRANMTEENADFGERSVHQLGFNASLGLGKVRPGVHFRLPLDDDLKEPLDFVFGLHLGVQW